MRKVTFIKSIIVFLGLIWFVQVRAQVQVHVNFDVKHEVGGISTFDRSKFITMHADQVENEWDGNNFTADLRNDFLEGYDVYLGRNTGGISWTLRNQVREDPLRPGFADPAHMATLGATNRSNYAARTAIHPYESRNNLILGGQLTTFWPDGTKTNTGWTPSTADTEAEPIGTATGEYMGHYIKEFFGDNGQPRPEYIEVVNEPLYYLSEYNKVFRFHNSVAKEIKKLNPEAKIGGYTVAFPDFEVNNFNQWNERDKAFVDIAGENMDFWSWHLYDFVAWGNGVKRLRSGSNVEATFDMMDQYSMLKLGHAKPYVISEYGSVAHKHIQEPWSANRDWLQTKSISSLLMSFLERPHDMIITIPFNLLKAEWYTEGTYNHRLMVKQSERDGGTSNQWVYSDHILFYALWKNVKGTRVDTYPSDLDIQADAYVDGNKAYLILNSLNFESTTIDLSLFGLGSNTISSINMKHLHINDAGNGGQLDDVNLDVATSQVVLKAEATMILEYTFGDAVAVTNTSKETKHFADSYLKPIQAGATNTFHINGLSLGNEGEAVLRLGVGRAHGKSLRPKILVNGKSIAVPEDFRGYDQLPRTSFFGVLEIPVPYGYLNADNQIDVLFDDEGGNISSVTLQAFEFSRQVKRIAVASITLDNEAISVATGKTRQLGATILPVNATNQIKTWSSDNEAVATIDANGTITGVSEGTATIKVETYEKDEQGQPFSATAVVTVDDNFVLQISDLAITPASITISSGDTKQLTVAISPQEAENKTLVWQSANEAIATVDQTGKITAVAVGNTTVSATTQDGSNITTTVDVTVADAGLVEFDNDNKYLGAAYKSGESIEITCNYNAGGATVNNDGIKFWLREIKPGWSVAKDYTSSVTSVAGSTSGTATATISLEGVTPTKDLPEGNFYFLFVNFTNTASQVFDKGIYPITIEAGASIAVASLTITPSAPKLGIGNTLTLAASVQPTTATDKSITWSSTDPAIATVSNQGVVTGVAEGSVSITATSVSTPSVKASVNIEVYEELESISFDQSAITLTAGESSSVQPVFTPTSATYQEVTWSSDNTGVASVDQTGNITAIAEGTTSVKATSVNNTSISGTLNVIVIAPLSNDPLPNTGVSIYPNPSNGMIQFQGLPKDTYVLKVYDMTGSEIKALGYSNIISHARIDMSDLKAGIYVLKLDGSGYNKSFNLVIGKE